MDAMRQLPTFFGCRGLVKMIFGQWFLIWKGNSKELWFAICLWWFQNESPGQLLGISLGDKHHVLWK